jgi:hypothetical protein
VELGRGVGVCAGTGVRVLVGDGRVGVEVRDRCLAQAHSRKRPAPIMVAMVLVGFK